MRPTRSTRLLLALLTALGVTATLAAPATAAMSTPRFSIPAEPLASYVPQATCSPSAKPGVSRFASSVLRSYPGTGSFGIVRACGVGGRSEHKEGRAWDWKVSAENPRQRAQAHDLLRWLFATDAKGVRAANARRVGVMYLIFDRKLWSASAGGSGWRPYKGASPHTDHMHLSFSWAGARGQTSWYKVASPGAPKAGIAPAPRTAPLPAPRPLPSRRGTMPGDGDAEGGWKPGVDRRGDDADSRAAALRAARERAAEQARKERRRAQEQARRDAVRTELRTAWDELVPVVSAAQMTLALAETEHDAAQEVLAAARDARDQARERRTGTRKGSQERALVEQDLAVLNQGYEQAKQGQRAARTARDAAAGELARLLRRQAKLRDWAQDLDVELPEPPSGDDPPEAAAPEAVSS